MAKIDPRIDTYIEKSAEFARPILKHIREMVHLVNPNIEETIKWGAPHFDYKGIMCGMAAFKKHCSFTFWKGSIMNDPHGILETIGKTGMGQLGKITSLDDLPNNQIFLDYLTEAVRLNEEGIKTPIKSGKKDKKELDIPDYFVNAIRQNDAAWHTFENFSYYNQKEYLEWITEAKTEKTREKRLANAVEWMAEGKVRNWKYLGK